MVRRTQDYGDIAAIPSNSRLFCGTPEAARCGPRRALTDDMLPWWRQSQVTAPAVAARLQPCSGSQLRRQNEGVVTSTTCTSSL